MPALQNGHVFTSSISPERVERDAQRPLPPQALQRTHLHGSATAFSRAVIVTGALLKITTMLGKGALPPPSPNLSRPLRKRISFACGRTISWNHLVSVRAGIRKTDTSASRPRLSHLPISRPYGGLQKTRFPVQSANSGASPSTCPSSGQGSKSKANSRFRDSNVSLGVAHLSEFALKCTLSAAIHRTPKRMKSRPAIPPKNRIPRTMKNGLQARLISARISRLWSSSISSSRRLNSSSDSSIRRGTYLTESPEWSRWDSELWSGARTTLFSDSGPSP